MARLFVAVVPPDQALNRVAALSRPALAGLRWTGRQQWHVTLRFLGKVQDVAGVVSALGGARLAAAKAAMGPATRRFGNRVLHVPVSGLEELAGDVVAATASLGQPPEDRPFVGHLTLARVAKGARVDLRPLASLPLAGSWKVSEVVLFESNLSPAGARYRVLERFPLTGARERGVVRTVAAP